MEILMRVLVSVSMVVFSFGMLNSLYLSLRYTVGGHQWDELESTELYC